MNAPVFNLNIGTAFNAVLGAMLNTDSLSRAQLSYRQEHHKGFQVQLFQRKA